MRKLISLILCLLMICLMLTGCSESFIEKFREDIHQYDDVVLDSDREELELDFYIICGEGTTDRSKEDVERYINAHLSDLYKTTLDIHYLSADEYEEIALADAKATGESRADIVLIAGKDMFDKFFNEILLANISYLYETKKYGLLNTIVSSTLLKSSIVEVQAVDKFGVSFADRRYYTVPNNHVIGEYDYILINKEMATDYLNYSPRQLSEMTTYELTAELRAKIGADADNYVKQVSGTYMDKAKYEAQGYHVNIASYPVADVEEAFSSAFSIVRHELDTRHLQAEEDISINAKNAYENHYDRCMEVVYALSSDPVLRNLLQYGHKGTNYVVDDNDNIVPFGSDDAGYYNMNLLYTGNVFTAYYCKDGWSKDDYLNGLEQNKQSVVPVVVAPPAE